MAAIEGAFMLYSFGVDGSEEMLKELGVSGNIKQKVSQKRTKYRLFQAKQDAKNKAEVKVDYYETLAFASEKLGMQLNPEMLLIEWIGYMKRIKDKIALEEKQVLKKKRR